ncbi:hypothetical protein [Natrinema halophilum]|uniref:Sulfatase n=1 Tax=Natrinema halophilum TaxID=1699371 RepID=A0A7D5GH77_9EURY|nr:hypothetical protein [Natrinema halophilum]QLG48854.1 hypothetical protein HYG82_08320 [Natrinema halophilum]
MSVVHFVRKLPERGYERSWQLFYQWIALKLPMRDFADVTVFDREWDVLVLLDACRIDLMAEVAAGYDWLPAPAAVEAGAIDSVAGSSKAWLRRTFLDTHAEEVANTAYVTGNPFSAVILGDDHRLGRLDEVWRYAWDDDHGSVRPDPITDRAISVCRDGDFDRVIVHYMQPHIPFLEHPNIHAANHDDRWDAPDSFVDPDRRGLDAWRRIQRGELDRDEVWEAYADNLRLGLESVDALRRNVNGALIVSSDHGNALGERGVWGHPDVPVSGIRVVPWIELEARDEGTGEPAPEPADEERTADVDVQERLASLGYTEKQC